MARDSLTGTKCRIIESVSVRTVTSDRQLRPDSRRSTRGLQLPSTLSESELPGSDVQRSCKTDASVSFVQPPSHVTRTLTKATSPFCRLFSIHSFETLLTHSAIRATKP